MKTLHFSTSINSPKEKVWQILWEDQTYRIWTAVFSEGSHAVSDWKEGDKILFLSPDGNGMYSKIEKSIPNEFMSFRHLGVVKDGKEQPQDKETEKWAGAIESYRLTENNGSTSLHVDVDIAEDHEKYFNETFPKALEKVKALAENG